MSTDKEANKNEPDGHVSPKRTRRGSSNGNSGSAGLQTPERKSDHPRQQQQPQQQTPKSDFKNFAESMGSPFGIGVGLFSPQSNAPFTPGSIQGGPNSSAAAPTSRDWSPFCHSANSFDFYASSPSAPPMNKIFHDMRGGRPTSSVDQSPEYISNSAWGGHLAANEMLMDQDQNHPGGIASPLGLNFPPPLQHLYPHHQHALGSSDVHENSTSRLSNDLFSANGADDKKRKHMTSSPQPTRIKETLDAPPSPGFEAITAAAKELESQSNASAGDKNNGGKAARRRGQKGKDKDKPMLAPPRASQAQGPGLLKGVVGALHCSTSSAGEQVPTMRYAQHASNGKGTGSSQSKTNHKGLPPYLPQKNCDDGDVAAKKSMKAELQTYMNSVDGSSGDSTCSGSKQMSSPESMLVGGIKVPDISPATKNVSVTCNCKKSKCLKLYCDCFRVQQYCSGCHCNNCSNLKEYESERQAAVAAITERNPEAFKPRITQVDAQLLSGSGGSAGLRARMGQHLQGCHCKKSACLKKYCECFQAEVPCHERCRCLECKNTPAAREAKLAAAGGREPVPVGSAVGLSSAVTSAANLKTYDDLKPPSNLLGNGGAGSGQVLQASHMDLTSALLSPTATPSRSVQTPSSGGGSSAADEDDLTPIYNKAQAEQAALEIVSAFLRGELTVPGVEYLSTKSSAMRNYSVTSSSQQRGNNTHAEATSSSLPLMEKLNDFEESRLRGQSGKEKLDM